MTIAIGNDLRLINTDELDVLLGLLFLDKGKSVTLHTEVKDAPEQTDATKRILRLAKGLEVLGHCKVVIEHCEDMVFYTVHPM